eukprot:8269974-Pyramimonas_sp.AAC.2
MDWPTRTAPLMATSAGAAKSPRRSTCAVREEHCAGGWRVAVKPPRLQSGTIARTLYDLRLTIA